MIEFENKSILNDIKDDNKGGLMDRSFVLDGNKNELNYGMNDFGNEVTENEEIGNEYFSDIKMIENDLRDDEAKGFNYIENQTNLEIQNIASIEVDEQQPVSWFKKISGIINDRVKYNKFFNEVEKIGEDVARYKWAYDEGKLGEFEGGKFVKETFKAGFREVSSGGLKIAGNVLNIIGNNIESNPGFGAVVTMGGSVVLPQAKEVFIKVGNTLNEYADKIENLEFWAPSEEAYQEEPNWMSVANILGQGSGSVVSMGGISKVIGSKATYGLFAVGGSGDIFNESIEKGDSVFKANTLGAMSASSSYVIDRVFNPLPKQLEKGVKTTSSMICKEMFNAPFREVESEMLQQVVSENLIRKIGIDDSQALFEGLIESTLGAMAGNMVVSGVDGSVYYASKNLKEVEKRIRLKGVSDEEIELYKNNMLEFIKSKPEAFEKVLRYNLDKNIEEIVKTSKSREEKKEVKKDLENLPKIYDTMYERFRNVIDDDKAKASARMFEANALFWRQYGENPRYLELLEGFLPEVKKVSFDDFIKSGKGKGADFQFVGVNAKGIDYDKLEMFKKYEEKGYDPQVIWKYTGAMRGSDGKIRIEINSDEAKLKLFGKKDKRVKNSEVFENEIVRDLEELKRNLAYSLISRENDSYSGVFKDFYEYLRKNRKEVDKQSVKKSGNFKHLNRRDFDNVIDESIRVRRKYEEILLDNVYENFKKGKNNFSQDDIKYLRGKSEAERFDRFLKEYWGRGENEAVQRMSFELLNDNSKWAMSDEFKDRLKKLYFEYKEKRSQRDKELEKAGVLNKTRYFRDLDFEESYRIKLAQNQESDEDFELRDYKPFNYRKSHAPFSFGERFLDEKHYDFLEKGQRDELLGYLDNIEKYYRLERYLENYNKIVTDKAIENNIMGTKGISDENDVGFNDRRLLLHNGKKFRLDDVLEYDELFVNYPDLKESKVLFTRLVDGESYHFYWNKDEGYVFEIDGEQCDSDMFLKILLRGTNFAIQHKEGYDYTLTDKQKKNFMDRNLYRAKKRIEDDTKEELEMFLMKNGFIGDGKEADKYWKVSKMPVSMLNIYRSKSVDADKKAKFRNMSYGEIDFDKIQNDIESKFVDVENIHQESIRRQMLSDLFSLKEKVAKRVMYLARMDSGYRDVGFAWSGVASQGYADDRNLFKPKEVRLKRAKDVMVDLNPERRFEKEMDFNIENKLDVVNRIWDEDKAVISDKKAVDFISKEAALGAYDFNNNVISIFKDGDTETILHECFHYFYEFLKKSGRTQNEHVEDVFEAMNDIKVSFLGQYDIEEREGKYFAVSKDNGEVYNKHPLGYATEDELLDKVAKEVFVERLLRVMNKKDVNREDLAGGVKKRYNKRFDEYENYVDSKVKVDPYLMNGASKIYLKWLQYMVKALEVNENDSGQGGKKVLKTLGVK